MATNCCAGRILVVFLVAVLGYGHGISVEEDLTLTYQQKLALDKFKTRVLNALPKEHMKSDIYLVKWLRARNFNVDSAEQLLRQNLRWRQDNKMDSIESEDWSDMRDDFQYETDAFDKEGRPVGTLNIGSWNFRRIALTGKMPRLLRYMDKLLEEATQAVVQAQEEGKNVTQWKVILNMENFNVVQHLPQPAAYVNFLNSYENHYTGYADALVLINTPPTFQIILELVKPIFSVPTQRALKIFGTDKRQWKEYLDKEIDEKMLRPEFGGTKID